MVPYAGVEDPFLYTDRGGIFHAVFHNQIENDNERLSGGHAYSEDGRAWTFTGTSWSNVVEFTRSSSNAEFTDWANVAARKEEAARTEGDEVVNEGYTYEFSRRERPHLVFGDPTDPYLITGLTTGVQYGEGAPIFHTGQDACYTLLQPVRRE